MSVIVWMCVCNVCLHNSPPPPQKKKFTLKETSSQIYIQIIAKIFLASDLSNLITFWFMTNECISWSSRWRLFHHLSGNLTHMMSWPFSLVGHSSALQSPGWCNKRYREMRWNLNGPENVLNREKKDNCCRILQQKTVSEERLVKKTKLEDY